MHTVNEQRVIGDIRAIQFRPRHDLALIPHKQPTITITTMKSPRRESTIPIPLTCSRSWDLKNLDHWISPTQTYSYDQRITYIHPVALKIYPATHRLRISKTVYCTINHQSPPTEWPQ